MFSSPSFASVGLSEEEAVDHEKDVDVFTSEFTWASPPLPPPGGSLSLTMGLMICCMGLIVLGARRLWEHGKTGIGIHAVACKSTILTICHNLRVGYLLLNPGFVKTCGSAKAWQPYWGLSKKKSWNPEIATGQWRAASPRGREAKPLPSWLWIRKMTKLWEHTLLVLRLQRSFRSAASGSVLICYPWEMSSAVCRKFFSP